MFARPRSLFLPLLALCAMLAGGVPAQDPATLARDANTKLRAAERSMFSGKLEQAQTEFAEATKLVDQLAKLEPKHSRLRSLRTKQQKLQRDLDRRAGKKPEKKGEQGKGETPGKSVKGGKKLPIGAVKMLEQVDAGIARLRAHLADDAATDFAARAKTAEELLAKAGRPLERFARIYGKQVPADHPEQLACRARLAAAAREAEAFAAKMAVAADATATKGPSAEQIANDAKEVKALAKAHLDALSLIHGNSLVYGLKLEHAQKALTQIEAVETAALPVLQPVLARVAKTYGTTAMTVNNTLHGLGAPRDQQFGSAFERLVEGAQNVAKSRTASAAAVARNAQTMLGDIDRIAPDVRVPRMKEWKEILQVGQKLDPNNADINAWLADMDARIDEISTKIEQDIDAKVWAGHVPDFAGPGTVEELASQALTWFQKDKGWGGNPKRKVEILAVAVRGPWQVAERDVFARIVRWRLPIHVAVTDEALRAKKVARVYELSIVGLEGAPGAAAKAPPFDGCWVGANWKVRLDKVPR